MTKYLTGLLLILYTPGFSQEISATIFACDPGYVYRYAKGEVVLEGTWTMPDTASKIMYRKRLDKATYDAFEKIISEMVTSKFQVLVNNSTADGFSFKIYLRYGKKQNKIFVKNYYDEKVDVLTRLFDEVLKDYKSEYMITLGYGTDVADLKKLQQLIGLHSPADVPDIEINRKYLNEFCELKQ